MADTIQEVLQAFAKGELVVVTDDDDREGEGDLIVAASFCTAEKMAFIIRHTSGIVCAPITTDDARRLGCWRTSAPRPTRCSASAARCCRRKRATAWHPDMPSPPFRPAY